MFNRIIFIEKKSIFRFGDLKLFPSEIHLMQLINQESGLNATQMAKGMGVSKGAISQTLSRLVKKGVVRKNQESSYKNELTAEFTSLGREAMDLFEAQQASVRKPYADYLAGLSAMERKTISEFLAHTQSFLDELE